MDHRTPHPCDGLLQAGGRTVQLPGVLGTVHRVLGLDLTLRFIDLWGGGDIHIPQAAALDPDHALVRELGAAAATALAQTLGRPRFEPYRVPNGQTELGWYLARSLRLQGLPVPEIRRALLDRYRIRLTERRIRTLVSDLDPPRIAA